MLADLEPSLCCGKPVYDVTFENVQAGLRTDYLFRLANQNTALVVGTGDLSELALGWCTYGVGDQMSHYNVNASVAKTLIQHLIRFVASSGEVDRDGRVLRAVLATEISPELVPPRVGKDPVERKDHRSLCTAGLQPLLPDAIWLQTVENCLSGASCLGRCRARPGRLTSVKRRAYGLREIRHWLALFLERFFANQFKRSALPNGPKFPRVARCPRGAIGEPRQMRARMFGLRSLPRIARGPLGNAERLNWLAKKRTEIPRANVEFHRGHRPYARLAEYQTAKGRARRRSRHDASKTRFSMAGIHVASSNRGLNPAGRMARWSSHSIGALRLRASG